MEYKKVANYIAKKEGKKHEASVGDIREILKIIVDNPEICCALICEMTKRKNKKYKKIGA